MTTITITIDPETNEKTIAVDSAGMVPAVAHESLTRMARYLAVLREVNRGCDVDTVFFTYFAFTDD